MASFLSLQNVEGYYHRSIDLAVRHPILAWIAAVLGLRILYKIVNGFFSRQRISPIAGRYILVTGCGRGFGKDITKRLDAMGCYVFAACRSQRGMAELDKETSERCEVIKMDISNPEEVRSAFQHIKSKIPPGQGLWGLVNNAGIGGNINGPADWLTVEAYREVLEVNLFGTIDVTMTFLPLVKKAKGRVVNVSSTYGKLNLSFASNYGVSKFGLEGFSDGLRRDLLKYKCKVVVVEPGLVNTDLNSEEIIREAVSKSWNKLSPEMREEYGEDYFEKFIKKLTKNTEFTFWNTVTVMTDGMEQALFAKCPPTRILVGNDNQYVYKYLMMLPDSVTDWILDKLLGFPLPAILQSRR